MVYMSLSNSFEKFALDVFEFRVFGHKEATVHGYYISHKRWASPLCQFAMCTTGEKMERGLHPMLGFPTLSISFL